MHQAQHVLRNALSALRGPQVLILALALGLAFAWFGPAALALGLPFALMLVPRGAAARGGAGRCRAPAGQMSEMAAALDHRLRAARRARHPVLCITLAIHDFPTPEDALGERLVTTCLDALSHGLRAEDALFNLGGGRFGVLPDAARGMDAATARRLAARLEGHAETCLSGIRGAAGRGVTAGICLEMQPGTRGARAMIADSLAAAQGRTGG
jgi:GGDEF domain-containing protein